MKYVRIVPPEQEGVFRTLGFAINEFETRTENGSLEKVKLTVHAVRGLFAYPLPF